MEKQMLTLKPEEFESCPIGIKNSANIEHLSETFDLKLDAMVERIEQKIDAMNDKIQTEFVQMNEKMDNINNKVNSLDKKVGVLDKKLDGVDNLESFIESKVENKIKSTAKDKVWGIAKWIIGTLLGTSAAVFTAYMIKLIVK